MSQYTPIEGIVTSVSPMSTAANDTSACTLMISLFGTDRQTYNIVLAPDSYVLNQEPVRRGDLITVFYDSMAPVPLIYPPQYRAVAVVKTRVGQNAMLDFFDQNLVNSDGTLMLNRSGSTDIRLQNGQRFLGVLGNQILLVIYSITTRSIPAQTTPSLIVVFCTPA